MLPIVGMVFSLLIASSEFARAASGTDQLNSEQTSEIMPLFAAIPAGTKWVGLSEGIKTKLLQVAQTRQKVYDQAWDAKALSEKRKNLQDAPTKEMTEAFDQFVLASFPNQVPDDFKASLAVKNPILLAAMKDLFLSKVATGRGRSMDYGAGELDWNGKAFDEYVMPSLTALTSAEALAGRALSDLKKIKPAELNETEKTILKRLQVKLVSVKTGSIGIYGLGGEDPLTPYGRAAMGGGLLGTYDKNNPAEFLRQATAFWLAPVLKDINAGTVESAVNFTMPLHISTASITRWVGDPTTDPIAKAFTLLSQWYIERLQTHPDAQKKSRGLSLNAQRRMWQSSQADMLVNLQDQSSIEEFQVTFQTFLKKQTTESQKTAILLLKEIFPIGASLLTEAARAQVIAVIQAQKTFGTLTTVIPKALDEATGSNEASQIFQAELKSLPTLGGYAANTTISSEDIATAKRMWNEVKSYLAQKYSGGPVNLADALPADLILSTTISTSTNAKGEVTLNLNTSTGLSSIYSTLLHEAKHSIDRRTGMAREVEGSAWEGAAQLVEMRVVPDFLTNLFAGDTKKIALMKFAMVDTQIRYASRTEATLAALTAKPEEDSIETCRQIATKWGLPDSAIPALIQRSFQGLQYIQYLGGSLIFSDLIDYLQAQVQPSNGRMIDPFVLQMYGANSAGKDSESVEKLKEYLSK